MIENIDFAWEGTKLVATIDLSVEGRLSKTGKSVLVATTGGEKVTLETLFSTMVSTPEDADTVIGINVYRPLAA